MFELGVIFFIIDEEISLVWSSCLGVRIEVLFFYYVYGVWYGGVDVGWNSEVNLDVVCVCDLKFEVSVCMLIFFKLNKN